MAVVAGRGLPPSNGPTQVGTTPRLWFRRGGRIRREGRDVRHPLITTRRGEIPEQVSARADSAPILGYATLRTTRLTNLSRPKLTSSAPAQAAAKVLGVQPIDEESEARFSNVV